MRTNFRLAGDFDLWARFYDHADLHVINGPLGGFRFQPDQRSRKIDEYVREARISLDEARERNGWRRSRRALRTARRIPVVRRWAYRRPLYIGSAVEPVDPYQAECGWRTTRVEFG